MKYNEGNNKDIFDDILLRISEITNETTDKSSISYDDLPQYDLFLSQVKDYLNDRFDQDNFTNSILQNYIKSDVVSKPEDGRKRGYTKLHLVQLVLIANMRPILTTDEIRSVFRLAFNDINSREDDILSWEDTYKMFGELQEKSLAMDLKFIADEEARKNIFNKYLEKYEFNAEEKERIMIFLVVMSLVAQASNIKKLVTTLVKEYGDKYN
ncbi:MAG: DUF1836 domain-containing protein [Clostridium sp.]|uniref:DUF1836 domain-containing protein n=1 Tax=Clostridium culturomicium TaxID=1499683 RepID=UPI0005A88936|nr:DUF1836 domain-containing protein [Clostridium culturomicium]MDU4892310.1 DUF1836 domain-containing protein [Clostridium sp.]MDU7085684.1 DUF1836 domain-containing protein [Clostridium sp.]